VDLNFDVPFSIPLRATHLSLRFSTKPRCLVQVPPIGLFLVRYRWWG